MPALVLTGDEIRERDERQERLRRRENSDILPACQLAAQLIKVGAAQAACGIRLHAQALLWARDLVSNQDLNDRLVRNSIAAANFSKVRSCNITVRGRTSIEPVARFVISKTCLRYCTQC